MKLSEAEVKVCVWKGVMGIVLFAGLGGLLFSCQNKSKQLMGCQNMPEFENRFPEKTVVTSGGKKVFTFSSMEALAAMP